MAPELLILFPISIACDVVGQVFFKLGADRLSARAHSSALTFSRALLRERWLLAGIATFAVETIIWLRILSLCPLSIAFPIAALNFIGVTLAARVIFAETISAAQWVGCGLVTVGVAVLAAATVGPT